LLRDRETEREKGLREGGREGGREGELGREGGREERREGGRERKREEEWRGWREIEICIEIDRETGRGGGGAEGREGERQKEEGHGGRVGIVWGKADRAMRETLVSLMPRCCEALRILVSLVSIACGSTGTWVQI
jgi:hypothetical protein